MNKNILKYYYQVLEINQDASLKEIQNAYFKMMKKYHPDVYHQKNAEEKAKEINNAYFEILKYVKEEGIDKKSKYKNISVFNDNSTIYPDLWLNISKKIDKNIFTNSDKRLYMKIDNSEAIVHYSIKSNKIHIDSILFNRINNEITMSKLITGLKNTFEKSKF